MFASQFILVLRALHGRVDCRIRGSWWAVFRLVLLLFLLMVLVLVLVLEVSLDIRGAFKKWRDLVGLLLFLLVRTTLVTFLVMMMMLLVVVHAWMFD